MNSQESPQNSEEFLKNLKKTSRNDGKTLPKLLKWLGKIDKVAQYDDYKKNVLSSILEWFFLVFIIRSLVIGISLFFCLSAVTFATPPTIIRYFYAAEGISLSWFLLIELKRDLWRK